MNPAAGGAPGSLRIGAGAIPVPVFAQPFDGRAQAVFERDARRPAEQLRGLRVVREQALDLAFFGTNALALGLDFRVATGEPDDELREVADGDFAIRAEVERLADRRVVRCCGDVTLAGVR